MRFYFAPLEGIGGYIYRNAHYRFFGNIDKYFAPFITAGPEIHFHKREIRDVKPENNIGVPLVPQILTNHVQAFVETAKVLREFGYEEVNLNLGCPSRTVVAKGKGAGFLAEPERLDAFLAEIFAEVPMKISIKTRLGINNKEEAGRLMEIFNQYPLSELIIHPRIQKDYYSSEPDWLKFKEALEISKVPVCYNGNIFSRADYQRFSETFPTVDRVMLGRGILANPGLVGEILGLDAMNKVQVRQFHDCLLQEYRELFGNDRNTLFKMKELWCYLAHSFSNTKKYEKKIRKAEKMPMYLDTVNALFAECDLVRGAGFVWKG